MPLPLIFSTLFDAVDCFLMLDAAMPCRFRFSLMLMLPPLIFRRLRRYMPLMPDIAATPIFSDKMLIISCC